MTKWLFLYSTTPHFHVEMCLQEEMRTRIWLAAISPFPTDKEKLCVDRGFSPRLYTLHFTLSTKKIALKGDFLAYVRKKMYLCGVNVLNQVLGRIYTIECIK